MALFKLVFFTPREHTKRVLDHLFSKLPIAVGSIGQYEHCAFVTPGTGQLLLPPSTDLLKRNLFQGQFKPKPGAHPTIGTIGEAEFVEEDRVEVLVTDHGKDNEIKEAIKELKKVISLPDLNERY